jgi:hypothetical protein
MITGKDIEELEETIKENGGSIAAEEAEDIMTYSSNMVKGVLTRFLKQYDNDDREHVQTEVMLYANMSMLDVSIKTLLFMTHGSRRHVEEVFNNLMSKNLEDPEVQELIKKDKENAE